MKKLITFFTLCVLISHVRSQNKPPIEITLPENWTADSTGSGFTFDRYAVSNDIFFGQNITIDILIYAFTDNSKDWSQLVTNTAAIKLFVQEHGAWNIQNGLNLFVIMKDDNYAIVCAERNSNTFSLRELSMLTPLPMKGFPFSSIFIPRKKSI
jgi:hypothetical protein